MGTKYIENTGRDIIYVGGKMIPPGEGRDIDTNLLPAELQDRAPALATVEVSLVELLQELLGKGVKAIAVELPDLTHEALDLLADLEGKTDTPRSTLLGAIKAEQIRRAQQLQEEAQNAELAAFEARVQAAYELALQGLTAEQLEAIGEDEKAALRAKAEESVRAADATTPAA
ncbi:hypothetical protein [Hydrogenophaga sp.]|uniref:hypothetical protein n=1 Tax=Hydrogenophaga sp. TaxID=1904254 RepID=UPI003D0A39DF